MSKYRLVETKITDGTGKVVLRYDIQKKWLFFWFHAIVTTHYFTYKNRALLIGRNFYFTDKARALKVLDHLNNPYSEIYEGYKIVRVLDDNDFMPVFINKDDFEKWDDSLCYKFNHSLDDLKRSIKEKVKTKTRKIIG